MSEVSQSWSALVDTPDPAAIAPSSQTSLVLSSGTGGAVTFTLKLQEPKSTPEASQERGNLHCYTARDRDREIVQISSAFSCQEGEECCRLTAARKLYLPFP